jgi:hypothetical protein
MPAFVNETDIDRRLLLSGDTADASAPCPVLTNLPGKPYAAVLGTSS